MSDEINRAQENPILESFSAAALELFSSADSSEEVAEMRDDILSKVAQGATEARQRVAEQEAAQASILL